MATNPAPTAPSKAEPRIVTVRATKVGFYIGRRRVGDEFDFPLKGEMPSWMELASNPPTPPAPESTVPPMTGRLSISQA